MCQNDWDTLGMRASSSHSWVFENLFVEDAAVTRRKAWEWDEYVRGIWAWHGGTFASIYLGIVCVVRDFAVAYTKTRTRLPFHKPESHYLCYDSAPGRESLLSDNRYRAKLLENSMNTCYQSKMD